MSIQIVPVPTAAIAGAWPVLGPLLAPAVAYDQNVTLDAVRAKLIAGQCEAAIVTAAGGQGVVVTELCVIDGVRCCWLSYVAGKLSASPKEWVRTMRSLVGQLEDMARSVGCEEMRGGGRDWSRILPDYERFDAVPNGMRKVLKNG